MFSFLIYHNLNTIQSLSFSLSSLKFFSCLLHFTSNYWTLFYSVRAIVIAIYVPLILCTKCTMINKTTLYFSRENVEYCLKRKLICLVLKDKHEVFFFRFIKLVRTMKEHNIFRKANTLRNMHHIRFCLVRWSH